MQGLAVQMKWLLGSWLLKSPKNARLRQYVTCNCGTVCILLAQPFERGEHLKNNDHDKYSATIERLKLEGSCKLSRNVYVPSQAWIVEDPAKEVPRATFFDVIIVQD